MKKILAILLAVLMLGALCVTAFAAEIPENPADLTGHTFTAYQIFTGTQTEGEPDLADIDWGKDVTAATLLADLRASDKFGTPNPFADCSTAFDVANAMDGWADDSAKADAFAEIVYKNLQGEGIAVENGQTEIDAGYYLVVDTTEGEVEVRNLNLLQQTNKGTFEIRSKVDVPTVVKKLSDASGLNCKLDHDHNKDCYNWEDADKVAIGDTVLFDLHGTIPTSAASYDYYYYIISDTLSDGLNYADGLMVYIGGDLAAENVDYRVKVNGQHIEIALLDAKGNAGKTVDAIYAAELDEDAIIGVKGNPNEVTVKYSNNPNFDYDGTSIPGDEGWPDEEKDVPTGETPKDITLTYTTALKLYKVDQDGDPLKGAEFTLEGTGMNIVLVARDEFTVSANGEYWKLTNGSYTKTPPTTEDSMEPVEGTPEKGYVVAENGYAGQTVVVKGVAYRPYKAADAGKQVYIYHQNNVEKYDSITTKYTKAVVVESQINSKNVDVTVAVDDMGILILEGLNKGTYTLTETKTPDGYNPIDPISFSIDCELPTEVKTGEETCKWTIDCDDANITYSAENDAFEITVVNQKGSVLPETGGIGTTIFYVLGGLLAAGAIILLVVKKRMGNEN